MHNSAVIIVEKLGGKYLRQGNFHSLPLPVYEVYILPLLRTTAGMTEYNIRALMDAKRLDYALSALYPSDNWFPDSEDKLYNCTYGTVPNVVKQIRAVMFHF